MTKDTMPFLVSFDIKEEEDGSAVIFGLFDGWDEPRHLLRMNPIPGQGREEFAALVGSMAAHLVTSFRSQWRKENGVSLRFDEYNGLVANPKDTV